MDPGIVPVKTAEGHDELAHRTRRLSQRHRTILLLVDGRRTADDVVSLARQAGVQEIAYVELIELGLIAEPATAAGARTSILRRERVAAARYPQLSPASDSQPVTVHPGGVRRSATVVVRAAFAPLSASMPLDALPARDGVAPEPARPAAAGQAVARPDEAWPGSADVQEVTRQHVVLP